MKQTIEERIASGEFDSKISFKDDRAGHRADEQRLVKVFKVEILKEVGLDDYPLKDRVFRKAWEDGHSSGLLSVWYEMDELSDLIVK